METIKIGDATIGMYDTHVEICILDDKHVKRVIPFSATRALQLAATLTERYGGGEWVSVEVNPQKHALYMLKGADYPYGIWNNEHRVFWHPTLTKQLKPTHYQIIQP